jgi:hypothetical protein
MDPREISEKLAELDKVVRGLHESIERLARSTEEREHEPSEESAAEERGASILADRAKETRPPPPSAKPQAREKEPEKKPSEKASKPSGEERAPDRVKGQAEQEAINQQAEAAPEEEQEEAGESEEERPRAPSAKPQARKEAKAEKKPTEREGKPPVEARAPDQARAQAEQEARGQQAEAAPEEEQEEEPEEQEEAGESEGPHAEAAGEPEEEEAPEERAEASERAEAEPAEGAESEEPEQEATAAEETEEEPEEEPSEAEAPQEEQAEETLTLFDGTEASAKNWEKVGAGGLEYRNKLLHLRSDTDRGLVYCSAQQFNDFRLRVEYKLDSPEAPATIALRFLDPRQPVPDRESPEKPRHYDNEAYVAIHTGLEVRMGSASGGEAGTFVGIPVGDSKNQQHRAGKASLKTGDWNEITIEAHGNEFTVRLNGVETARFANPDTGRGVAASAIESSGYIGFLLGAERRTAATPRSTRPTGRALPSGISGPLVPRRAPPRRPAPPPKSSFGAVEIRRVEVELFEENLREGEEHESSAQADRESGTEGEKVEGAQKEKGEEKKKKKEKKLTPKDAEALHKEVVATLTRLEAKNPGLKESFQKAYGYAIFPSVGRAGLVVGGARGYGEVFERGKPIGFARVTQLTIGVHVGGQTFSEVVLFGSRASLRAFKSSPVAFDANASVAFIRGATGTTDFKDMTARAYSRGGMLLEASLGGQKFRFYPREAILGGAAREEQPREAEQKEEGEEEGEEAEERSAPAASDAKEKVAKTVKAGKGEIAHAMGDLGRATKGVFSAFGSKVRRLRHSR